VANQLLISSSELESIKRKALAYVDAIKDQLRETSLTIFSYAEPPFEEYKSSELLVASLRANGFSVEKPLAGLQTAFRGVSERDGNGPTIAFTAEYDAIRVLEYGSDRIMGHACGHNLNATASLGAALTVSQCLPEKIPGSVCIVGTPGEEDLGRGGKLTLIEKGVFKKVDAAMMMHGTLYRGQQDHYFTSPHSTSYLRSLMIHFKGNRSPLGRTVNAVDPLTQFLQGLYIVESHFGPQVTIRRIVLRGGETPAAVPVETVAHVWIQSKMESLVREAEEAVNRCAVEAALAIGAQAEIEEEGRVKSVVCNPILERIAGKNASRLRLKWKDDAPLSPFSTDFGNVSHLVPGFYLKVPIGTGRFHTIESMPASKSDRAHAAMIDAVKLLSLTAIDLFAAPPLLNKSKREHKKIVKARGAISK
jgi:amidohydrolase